MSDIAEKVKKIIIDRLGVDESEVTPEASLPMTWELTHWIQLS